MTVGGAGDADAPWGKATLASGVKADQDGVASRGTQWTGIAHLAAGMSHSRSALLHEQIGMGAGLALWSWSSYIGEVAMK